MISSQSLDDQQEEVKPYIHRGIYDNDGHSHVDSREPTMSGTRCTTIYKSKNMRQQYFEI